MLGMPRFHIRNLFDLVAHIQGGRHWSLPHWELLFWPHRVGRGSKSIGKTGWDHKVNAQLKPKSIRNPNLYIHMSSLLEHQRHMLQVFPLKIKGNTIIKPRLVIHLIHMWVSSKNVLITFFLYAEPWSCAHGTARCWAVTSFHVFHYLWKANWKPGINANRSNGITHGSHTFWPSQIKIRSR